MFAGIRTVAEVIALALEDGGISIEQSKILSEDAAKRLSVALQSLSTKDKALIVFSPKKDEVDWGHIGKPCKRLKIE